MHAHPHSHSDRPTQLSITFSSASDSPFVKHSPPTDVRPALSHGNDSVQPSFLALTAPSGESPSAVTKRPVIKSSPASSLNDYMILIASSVVLACLYVVTFVVAFIKPTLQSVLGLTKTLPLVARLVV